VAARFARARTDDPELEAIATRLFAYFDDPQHSAMPVLGTADRHPAQAHCCPE
jgi:hypothetical protein